MKKHMIISEEIFITSEDTEIVTMVGSSVAVTLFDRVQKIGGVLHFFEPEWSGIGIRNIRYGDVGVAELVKKFFDGGSQKENLIANIIGGATLGGFNSIDILPIGLRNVQVVKRILDKEQIAIDRVEVGKEIGRYLSFKSSEGTINIKENRAN
jgi:chemotaxis protein CheD